MLKIYLQLKYFLYLDFFFLIHLNFTQLRLESCTYINVILNKKQSDMNTLSVNYFVLIVFRWFRVTAFCENCTNIYKPYIIQYSI